MTKATATKGTETMITPRQADSLIKSGKRVVVQVVGANGTGEVFQITIVSRDRWSIKTGDGGVFSRDDLEIRRTD